MIGVATAAAVAMLVLAVLLAVSIVGFRLTRHLLRRRQARRAARPRRVLLAVAAEGGGDEIEQLARLPARDWHAIEPTAFDLLGKIRGEAHAALAEVFARRAVLRRARRDLHRFGAVRRVRAADTLGHLGDRPSVPGLCVLLGDARAEVRVAAVQALGRVGDPAAAPPLLDSVSGARPTPSQQVAHALVRLGRPAVPELVAALAQPDPLERVTALDALGLLGAAEAEQPVVALLRRDPAPAVRVRAAATLRRIGTEQAVAPLLASTDPAEPVLLRATATRSLGELGVRATSGVLAELLADPEHLVAHEAAEALLALGAPGREALAAVTGHGGGPAAAHAREALAVAELARRRREAVEPSAALAGPGA